MKWTRSKTCYAEYSTADIGLRHYIAIVRLNEYPNKFTYTYTINGSKHLEAVVTTKSMEEAEGIIAAKVKNYLQDKVIHWEELFREFNKTNAEVR